MPELTRRTWITLALICIPGAWSFGLIRATPAHAVTGHSLTNSFGSAGGGDGQFQLAVPTEEHAGSGLAVNSVAGSPDEHDVYVADTGNHRVDQFSASGAFIRSWGADVGGAGMNVCTSGCVPGTEGTGPGEFTTPTFIAVDNSSDASSGDVYVVDSADAVVQKFSAEGVLQASWGVGGKLSGSDASGTGTLSGATGTGDTSAATGTGNLAAGSETVVNVATSTGAFQVGQQISGPGIPGGTTIAKVISSTELQLSQPAEAEVETAELAAGSTTITAVTTAPGGAFAVGQSISGPGIPEGATITAIPSVTELETSLPATEQGTGVALAAGTRTITGVSASTGAFQVGQELIGTGIAAGTTITGIPAPGELEISTLPTASGSQSLAAQQPFTAIGGIAVNASGDLLVYNDETGNVFEFAEDGTPDPVISSEAAVDRPFGVGVDSSSNLYRVSGQSNLEQLGPSGAQAGAVDISPGGFDAGFAVNLATNELYVDSTNSFAIRLFGAGCEPAVALCTPLESFGNLIQAGGLAVDSTDATVYAAEASEGKIDAFSTETVTPKIDSVAANGLTSTSATLTGQVNPEEVDTTAHFVYGETTAYGHAVPATDLDLGAGVGDQSITAHLQGLNPNTTYHYALVISSSATGTVTSADHTFTTQGAASSGVLPDDRGWEMVSPLDKNGNEIRGIEGASEGGVVEASEDGQRVTYVSLGAFGEALGAPLGSQYLGTRTATGWNTTDLTLPLVSSGYALGGEGTQYKAFASDLSIGLAGAGGKSGGTDPVVLDPPLTPEAPAGYENLYVRNNETGGLQAVLRTVPAESPVTFRLAYEGASANFEHVIFGTGAALTEHAVAGDSESYNLYEWIDGKLVAINVVPGATGGATFPGAEVGAATQNYDADFDRTNAVTDDGSRVFFSDQSALYVRENPGAPSAKTALIADGGTYWTASTDGETAIYTGNGELFAFHTATASSSDLTPDAESGGARVQGLLGASPDASFVYFVADGRLTAGAPAGNCNLARSGEACNLYVSHNGDTHRIATLPQADATDWAHPVIERTARVSADGRHVVFMSQASLTGYDNNDASSGKPDDEVYEYSAPTGAEEEAGASGSLVCVSCDPSGARPRGSAGLPGGTPYTLSDADYQSRVMSSNGSRVFFDSNDALVPGDTNNQQDVYEWEAPGEGSCTTAASTYSVADEGCLALLSGGTADVPSSFVDASASGNDVFFITAQQLVPKDTDQSVDLYDARVGGGFPVAPALACSGSGCQGLPGAPPTFATPASNTFAGVGNFRTQPPASAPKPPTAAQIRAAKLAKALKACRKKRKKPRIACEKQARKRYGTKPTAKGGQ
jgi:hypothetical protein